MGTIIRDNIYMDGWSGLRFQVTWNVVLGHATHKAEILERERDDAHIKAKVKVIFLDIKDI